MTSKKSKIFNCAKCGAQTLKWSGRCLECGAWGTLEEGTKSTSGENDSVRAEALKIIDLSRVENMSLSRVITGIKELDRVLGGGLVPGSLVLLAGEPGIGKSTMLAQATDAIAKRLSADRKVIYVSGEESGPQVRDRFARLGCDLGKIFFVNDTNIEKIIATALKENPGLLILDSIQTMRSDELPSESGSVSQIRACTGFLMELAKKHDISVIVTGHITKDGQVAGPKTLEHMVDTVIYLEYDQSLQYRLLRATKNRFGSVNEIGIFEMTEGGFKEVSNPSAVFMDEDKQDLSGSAISCIFEGTRPYLVEVQALVTKTVFGFPQRKATGFDANRLQILTAVMQKRAGLNLSAQDIILNVVGGLKIKETAMDLAVCAAIISSLYDNPINSKTLFLGEVGLGGEVRKVGKTKERLKEALRLGFTEIYCPDIEAKSKKQNIYKIKNLSELNKYIQK